MKTYKNLYPQICSFENLFAAYREAARGKRGRPNVARFEMELESNLLQLQEELEGQTYRPAGYYHFIITQPKRRRISAAPFRDRVVHHALCRVIEPIFERRFIHDSYACRVSKGTHAALDRCTAFARRYPFVLQGDVVQFFPAIDHAILRTILAHVLADAQTLWLCHRIMESGVGVLADEYDMVYFPGDDLFAAARPRGLPIGNLTSQFWANVYLNELDQFVKRELKCRAYLRYCDDFLLFSESKQELHRWREAIITFLRSLRLCLHEPQSVVFPVVTGIPFLGFRVYPDHRRLKRRNGVAFARRLRAWEKAYATGNLSLEDMSTRVQGWIAHAKHGDTYGLRSAFFAAYPIPRRTV
ncbi:MAG: reverse transcriptase/maturase family protein [Anaerolineae bacterium]|jgi:retron-type reverse transcriptase|nr:reverse transcriptase/maturase family protein [Anaerolineae bacterium]MDH7473004.1 reverse transcriptase domain-containing protein [Anaerolineae bacterium]